MFGDNVPNDVGAQPLTDVMPAKDCKATSQLAARHRFASAIDKQSAGIRAVAEDDFSVHVPVL